MMVAVHLWRSFPESGREAHFQTFRVSMPDSGGFTAMDVLDAIRSRVDPSVAYFRHGACGRGLCGRCAARINGRPGLLCGHLVHPGEPLVLEPVSRRRGVRDLVCIPARIAFDKTAPSA